MAPADSQGYAVDVPRETGLGDGFYGGWYRATYDFAVQGGAIGTITLAPYIPANVIVYGGFFDVVTTFTGATNTLAIGLNTTTDLLAATAIATYGTIGMHAIIPVATAAAAVKSTAQRQIVLTLATAAVTAGKLFLYLLTAPSGAA